MIFFENERACMCVWIGQKFAITYRYTWFGILWQFFVFFSELLENFRSRKSDLFRKTLYNTLPISKWEKGIQFCMQCVIYLFICYFMECNDLDCYLSFIFLDICRANIIQKNKTQHKRSSIHAMFTKFHHK